MDDDSPTVSDLVTCSGCTRRLVGRLAQLSCVRRPTDPRFCVSGPLGPRWVLLGGFSGVELVHDLRDGLVGVFGGFLNVLRVIY